MVSKSTRPPAGPANASKAAGAPAPASAAASAPSGGFYDTSATQSAPAESQLGSAFIEAVRAQHIPIERMGSADVEVVERAAEEAIHDPDDLAAEIDRIRKIRRPLGAFTQKLALPSRLGYHRHWFNDVAGRIDEATANGWKHVTGNDGKPVARCVGSGRDKGALYAFAMELPEVFWQEDQDARHRAASDRISGLKKAPVQAAPGTAKPSDQGKFYSPSEMLSVETK